MFHKVRIIPSDTTRLHPPYSYSRQMVLATKPFSEEFNDGANLIKDIKRVILDDVCQ